MDCRKCVDYKVYGVTKIKGSYGFRVVLTFDDGKAKTQQHAGFKTKKEANKARDDVVGQLHSGTYIVCEKVLVSDFMDHWLEDVMRKKITDNTYNGYRNAIRNYIIPHIGKVYLSTLDQGHIRKLYNVSAKRSISVVQTVKTVLNTSLDYALNNKLISVNPARKVSLPKLVKKKPYRERRVDERKTLTLQQVMLLIEKSKDSPIHMQILFAVLMGLRKSEINGLKYQDVDYINRTLTIQRQLGKKANTTAKDFAPKMLTKQDIPTKTASNNRVVPIPDYVFEAILEERKKYERNRSRRRKEFRDLDYICCSTYGNPRSKGYHHKYFKDLLAECDLPDIRFHQLRSTYTTILMKNDFNSKGIASLLGHAKEIISMDVYGDTAEIIEDCLQEMEPFIKEVLPERNVQKFCDFSDVGEIDDAAKELLEAA